MNREAQVNNGQRVSKPRKSKKKWQDKLDSDSECRNFRAEDNLMLPLRNVLVTTHKINGELHTHKQMNQCL